MEVEKHNERIENNNETYLNKVTFLEAYNFEEWKKILIGFLPNITSSSRDKRSTNYKTSYKRIRIISKKEVKNLPMNFSLEKYLPRPVNQGVNCGSCYAFAAIAAIEGTMAKQLNKREKLSEMAAIQSTNGCDCGYSEWVYDVVKKKGGAAAASRCPYDHVYPFNKHFNCNDLPAMSKVVEDSQIIGYSNCKGQSHVTVEECMKFILVNNGPLSAYIDHDEDFNNYKIGIYSRIASQNLVHHAITIVGYGETNGKKYWLLRNSSGRAWGNKGNSFIYLKK